MTLKSLTAEIEVLERLQRTLESNKSILVDTGGETGYLSSIQYLQTVIATLTKKKLSLPIGYRFTGTFYVRQAYSVPISTRKVEGSAFMREDLVSWIIEEDAEITNQYYFREIYRDKHMETVIPHEEAQPVYAKQKEGNI
ncbi:MAG: hypothetical protein GY776_02160 [Alteromonas sp.]|nr:hypothetical protein [Alteromonas sp.]